MFTSRVCNKIYVRYPTSFFIQKVCHTIYTFINPAFVCKKRVANFNSFVETDWFIEYFSYVCQSYLVIIIIIGIENLVPECIAFGLIICHVRPITFYLVNKWIIHQCYILQLMISIHELPNPCKLQCRNKRFRCGRPRPSLCTFLWTAFLLILSCLLLHTNS